MTWSHPRIECPVSFLAAASLSPAVTFCAAHVVVTVCREVVASLIEEYKACESANYINWGMSGGGGAAAGAQAGQEAASAT